MPLIQSRGPAWIDQLLAGWRTEAPNFFWTPTEDALLQDQARGVVGTPLNGIQIGVGGAASPQGNANGTGYLQFPTLAGVTGANALHFGMMLVWVNDPGAMTGAFLKIGDITSGVGYGAGDTTFYNTGNRLIVLREEIQWHAVTANAFRAGLNVCSFGYTSAGVLIFTNLSTELEFNTGVGEFFAPVGGINIQGYTASRGSNNTVLALAVWAESLSNSAHVAKRERLLLPLLPLSGMATTVDELFAPRVQYIPTASGVPMPTLDIPTFVPGSVTSSGFRPRFPVTWA